MIRRFLLAMTLITLCQFSFANVLEKGKDYLFIQSANKAEIKATKVDNTYLLVLKNVSPYIIYFTNRPNRDTGHMPLEQFVSDWKKGADSFAKDQPNAGLEGIKFEGMKHGLNAVNYTFILSNPIYDKKDKTFTYTAKTLNGEAALKPADLGKLRHPVIFIDGVCYGCIG